MTIERKNGKAGSVMPHSSDLKPVPSLADADPQRSRSRDDRGRFATGNVVGRGRGWKRACGRLLGLPPGAKLEGPANDAANDARLLAVQTLRELPDDGPAVRGLVALQARHVALAAYWHGQAAVLGLGTPGGKEAEETATRHGQRAERLMVTALDVATAMAAAKRKAAPIRPAFTLATGDDNGPP